MSAPAMSKRPAVAVDTTAEFLVDAPAPKPAPAPRETDPRRLAQRRKQVELGKNTRGYARYLAAVPRDKRRFLHGGIVPIDPVTPDVHQSCSKRAFDGQVRKWRRMLHEWDPEDGDAARAEPLAGGPADAPGVSPGAKRAAAARTPASNVRTRKQGRKGEEGSEGGRSSDDADAAATVPPAADPPAADEAGKTIFDDWEDGDEDWEKVGP